MSEEFGDPFEFFVDLGTCPYFLGEGTCTFGCIDEPECRTCRPKNGWPSEGLSQSVNLEIGP